MYLEGMRMCDNILFVVFCPTPGLVSGFFILLHPASFDFLYSVFSCKEVGRFFLPLKGELCAFRCQRDWKFLATCYH